VINFSMERARDQASRIAHLDDDVLALANVVRYPTVVGTVPRIIDILS